MRIIPRFSFFLTILFALVFFTGIFFFLAQVFVPGNTEVKEDDNLASTNIALTEDSISKENDDLVGISSQQKNPEPESTLAEKEEAQVFTDTKNYLNQNGKLLLPLFVTQSNPKANQNNIALSQSLSIKFSRPVSRNLIIPAINPEVIGNWYYSSDNETKYLYRKLTFVPLEPMDAGTDYQIILKGNDELNGLNKNFHYQLNFRTKEGDCQIVGKPKNKLVNRIASAPEEIVAYGPEGNQALLDQTVKIIFAEPMQRESVETNFSITPQVSGIFQWSDDSREVTFISQTNLERSTVYSVILNQAALNAQGISLTGSLNFSFQTVGKVAVTKFYPKSSAKNVSVTTPIKFYFNQPVDQESARDHFVISPAAEGTITFPSDKVLVFQPQKLNYQTTYKVTMLPGIKAFDLPDNSFDSTSTYYFRFQTRTQNIRLSVPMDYQDYPLSCEIASLKMALAYKGKRPHENSILWRMRKNNSSRQGHIWGNPFTEFVGSLHGKQNSTGYGVYWKPIEKAAKSFRRYSRAHSFKNIRELTSQIKKGNPVVVWGTIGSWAHPDGWRTRSGKYIPAWVGEHARTVVGFVSGPNNPKYLIVHDPIAGKIYWRTSSFLKNWRSFGYKGVIVK